MLPPMYASFSKLYDMIMLWSFLGMIVSCGDSQVDAK